MYTLSSSHLDRCTTESADNFTTGYQTCRINLGICPWKDFERACQIYEHKLIGKHVNLQVMKISVQSGCETDSQLLYVGGVISIRNWV